ncbi:HK97 gp10 family phage protein [Bacillus sp. PAMC26568]|nr:HK97 gp10 family phage protein [Bacillus sp. PAMC26568]
MSVQLDGMAQLMQRISQLERNVEPAKKKALEKAGNYLANKIEPKVPVLTRQLQSTLRVSPVKDNRIEVGHSPDDFKSYLVEYGTSKMAAQPYFEPAVNAEKDNVTNILSSSLREDLDL